MSRSAQLADHVRALTEEFRERAEYFVDVPTHTDQCKQRTQEMTQAQRHHHRCPCPRAREARAETRRHPALLTQLNNGDGLERSAGTESDGGRTKPGSKPPRSLEAVTIIGKIQQETTSAHNSLADLLGNKARIILDSAGLYPIHHRTLQQQLRALVVLVAAVESDNPDLADDVTTIIRTLTNRARRTLGYDRDRRMRPLPDVSCPQCSTRGSLIVRADTDSDVICTREDEDGPCGARYPRYTWVELLEGQTA